MVTLELCRTSHARAKAFQRYLTGKTGFNLQVRVYPVDPLLSVYPDMSSAIVVETDRSECQEDIQGVLNMLLVDYIATTPEACPRCGTATEREPDAC